jgi:hypothetical protein
VFTDKLPDMVNGLPGLGQHKGEIMPDMYHIFPLLENYFHAGFLGPREMSISMTFL